MAPPKRDTTGVMLRLHANTLAALDDVIAKSGAELSRPALIRKMIKETLTNQGYDVREWVD